MFPDTDLLKLNVPSALPAIERDTAALGFDMPSVRETGALLRYLAALKPESKILELGTGTGLGSCWLLDGMEQSSHLVTVDNDENVLTVARRYLSTDPRVTVLNEDAVSYLERSPQSKFDLIFADAWPGKFSHLDQALSLLASEGCYVVDDLLPQSNWPDGHASRISPFIEDLRARDEFVVEYREWASGILIAQKMS